MLTPTRYTARWVLPVTGPPVEHGALLVDAAGRIAAVGRDAAVPRPADARRVDLGEAALMPGLVNAHAHPELTVYRGRIEDLAFPDWIAALQRWKQAVPFTAEEWLTSARLACLEALRAGITTLAATETTGVALDALREAGLRGVVYREVFGPDPAVADHAFSALHAGVSALRSRETDLVRVGISPHAPYSVSDALFRKVAEYARAEALPVAVHAAESDDEAALVCRGEGTFAARLAARGIDTSPRGRSTIELLDRLGVLATRPLLIHCVRVSADDVARIAANGATVAHCPIANARLGHGVSPLGRLLRAGIPVGLGSDSVASNNRMDLLEEARQAQLLQRARTRRAALLPAHRLLRMATLDGARALGLDSVTGSLEAGKDADLCAIALHAPHVVPISDPVTAVIHSARASDVVLTVVRGRIVLAEDGPHTLDTATVVRDFERMASRLREAMGAFAGAGAAERA